MSKKVSLDIMAPDFSLDDWKKKRIRLSEYRGKYHVILVFNRGFV